MRTTDRRTRRAAAAAVIPRAVMGRRSVLASTALALLAGAVPGIGSPRHATRGCCEAVAALWSREGGARRVGREYLAQAPDDADPDRLAEILFGDPRTAAAMSSAALRAHVARRRARDFETGDTVIVDGWVLARTEARLCALTVLA